MRIPVVLVVHQFLSRNNVYELTLKWNREVLSKASTRRGSSSLMTLTKPKAQLSSPLDDTAKPPLIFFTISKLNVNIGYWKWCKKSIPSITSTWNKFTFGDRLKFRDIRECQRSRLTRLLVYSSESRWSLLKTNEAKVEAGVFDDKTPPNRRIVSSMSLHACLAVRLREHNEKKKDKPDLELHSIFGLHRRRHQRQEQ
jgi:hypothetical protein